MPRELLAATMMYKIKAIYLQTLSLNMATKPHMQAYKHTHIKTKATQRLRPPRDWTDLQLEFIEIGVLTITQSE